MTAALQMPPVATVLASLILLAGCSAFGIPRFGPPSAGDTEDWGPLAVIDDAGTETLDAGLGPGMLHIGGSCVFLRLPGDNLDVTLIWRSGQTKWRSAAKAIVFQDARFGTVVLHDGENLSLGGLDPAGDSPETSFSPMWIAHPRPACPAALWVVHAVVVR